MRMLVTLSQVVLAILCGYLFISVISCDTANIKFSLALMAADIVVGVFLSSICAKGDDERRERVERQVDMIREYGRILDAEKAAAKKEDGNCVEEPEEPNGENSQKSEPSYYEKYLIALFKLGVASNQFKGNVVKGDAETEKVLVSKFRAVYLRLLMDGGKRRVDDIMEDEAGAYLVELCNWLEYSPVIKSFLNIFKLGAFSISEHSAIVYSFAYPPNSIACTMGLILVLTQKNNLRLFALETGAGGSSVLCEYTGYSHRNYGNSDESVTQKINEIIDEDEA